MEDNTPLNLEDHPKLFGLRYDQLIAILASLIFSTQFYSWCNPVHFLGQDLRLDFAMFLGMIGPLYALITMQETLGGWEQMLNFHFTSQVLIPGPDPNPTRFLIDEELPLFVE